MCPGGRGEIPVCRRKNLWFLPRARFPTQWDERNSTHHMPRRRNCNMKMLVSGLTRRLGNGHGKTYKRERRRTQELDMTPSVRLVRPLSLLVFSLPLLNFSAPRFLSWGTLLVTVGSSLALGNVTGKRATTNLWEERRLLLQAHVLPQCCRENLLAQYPAC